MKKHRFDHKYFASGYQPKLTDFQVNLESGNLNGVSELKDEIESFTTEGTINDYIQLYSSLGYQVTDTTDKTVTTQSSSPLLGFDFPALTEHDYTLLGLSMVSDYCKDAAALDGKGDILPQKSNQGSADNMYENLSEEVRSIMLQLDEDIAQIFTSDPKDFSVEADPSMRSNVKRKDTGEGGSEEGFPAKKLLKTFQSGPQNEPVQLNANGNPIIRRKKRKKSEDTKAATVAAPVSAAGGSGKKGVEKEAPNPALQRPWLFWEFPEQSGGSNSSSVFTVSRNAPPEPIDVLKGITSELEKVGLVLSATQKLTDVQLYPLSSAGVNNSSSTGVPNTTSVVDVPAGGRVSLEECCTRSPFFVARTGKEVEMEIEGRSRSSGGGSSRTATTASTDCLTLGKRDQVDSISAVLQQLRRDANERWRRRWDPLYSYFTSEYPSSLNANDVGNGTGKGGAGGGGSSVSKKFSLDDLPVFMDRLVNPFSRREVCWDWLTSAQHVDGLAALKDSESPQESAQNPDTTAIKTEQKESSIVGNLKTQINPAVHTSSLFYSHVTTFECLHKGLIEKLSNKENLNSKNEGFGVPGIQSPAADDSNRRYCDSLVKMLYQPLDFMVDKKKVNKQQQQAEAEKEVSWVSPSEGMALTLQRSVMKIRNLLFLELSPIVVDKSPGNTELEKGAVLHRASLLAAVICSYCGTDRAERDKRTAQLTAALKINAQDNETSDPSLDALPTTGTNKKKGASVSFGNWGPVLVVTKSQDIAAWETALRHQCELACLEVVRYDGPDAHRRALRRSMSGFFPSQPGQGAALEADVDVTGEQWRSSLYSERSRCHVLLVSYEALCLDLHRLREVVWFLSVFDEPWGFASHWQYQGTWSKILLSIQNQHRIFSCEKLTAPTNGIGEGLGSNPEQQNEFEEATPAREQQVCYPGLLETVTTVCPFALGLYSNRGGGLKGVESSDPVFQVIHNSVALLGFSQGDKRFVLDDKVKEALHSLLVAHTVVYDDSCHFCCGRTGVARAVDRRDQFSFICELIDLLPSMEWAGLQLEPRKDPTGAPVKAEKGGSSEGGGIPSGSSQYFQFETGSSTAGSPAGKTGVEGLVQWTRRFVGPSSGSPLVVRRLREVGSTSLFPDPALEEELRAVDLECVGNASMSQRKAGEKEVKKGPSTSNSGRKPAANKRGGKSRSKGGKSKAAETPVKEETVPLQAAAEGSDDPTVGTTGCIIKTETPALQPEAGSGLEGQVEEDKMDVVETNVNKRDSAANIEVSAPVDGAKVDVVESDLASPVLKKPKTEHPEPNVKPSSQQATPTSKSTEPSSQPKSGQVASTPGFSSMSAAAKHDSTAEEVEHSVVTARQLPPLGDQEQREMVEERGKYVLRKSGIWHANIIVASRTKFLGLFDTWEEAANTFELSFRQREYLKRFKTSYRPALLSTCFKGKLSKDIRLSDGSHISDEHYRVLDMAQLTQEVQFMAMTQVAVGHHLNQWVSLHKDSTQPPAYALLEGLQDAHFSVRVDHIPCVLGRAGEAVQRLFSDLGDSEEGANGLPFEYVAPSRLGVDDPLSGVAGSAAIPNIHLGFDLSVASRHAVLYWDRVRSTYCIRALSRAGVFLNGRKISPVSRATPGAPLHHKSILQVGSRMMYFLLPTAESQEDGSKGPISSVAGGAMQQRVRILSELQQSLELRDFVARSQTILTEGRVEAPLLPRVDSSDSLSQMQQSEDALRMHTADGGGEGKTRTEEVDETSLLLQREREMLKKLTELEKDVMDSFGRKKGSSSSSSSSAGDPKKALVTKPQPTVPVKTVPAKEPEAGKGETKSAVSSAGVNPPFPPLISHSMVPASSQGGGGNEAASMKNAMLGTEIPTKAKQTPSHEPSSALNSMKKLPSTEAGLSNKHSVVTHKRIQSVPAMELVKIPSVEQAPLSVGEDGHTHLQKMVPKIPAFGSNNDADAENNKRESTRIFSTEGTTYPFSNSHPQTIGISGVSSSTMVSPHLSQLLLQQQQEQRRQEAQQQEVEDVSRFLISLKAGDQGKSTGGRVEKEE